MKKPKTTITHRDVRVRDEHMVQIIRGVTKAGVHKDRKREASKKECRKKPREE